MRSTRASRQTGSPAYRRQKARARARSSAITAAGQEIGPIPPVVDRKRRARAEAEFGFFCEAYFPQQFTLPWSRDHRRVIGKIEHVVRQKETLAMAMPRGSGKTTLCLAAVVWAALTGWAEFIMLISGSEELALDALSNIRKQLAGDRLLLEDFPESIYPITKLEGESKRAVGQRYYGQQTAVEWSRDQIVFPTIPGSAASGAVIRVAGITGNIRGALFVRPDGRSVRPSLAIVDDPQTDQSARSPIQVAERLRIINGAVVGLAGPGKRTGVIIPCTVIRQEDLADQLLDREKNPLWRGERTKMVNKFPQNTKLWAEYWQRRKGEINADGDGSQATRFYKAHRKAMDRGADAAWPERFNTDELSGIQHAMNLRFRDEAAFFAEYQNDPVAEEVQSEMLTADEICERFNGRRRAAVPTPCSKLTAHIDVHDKLLYWCVCGWEPDFTGYVLDYGTLPQVRRQYFTMRSTPGSLSRRYGGQPIEQAIASGLEDLVRGLLAREWNRDDGAIMRLDLVLIDRGYKPRIVENVCRRVGSASVMPALGVGVGASGKPMGEYRHQPGQVIGHFWRIPSVRKSQEMRYLAVDTNYWKSFVHRRLGQGPGGVGSLTLWGPKDEAGRHGLFAEHLVSEFAVKVEGRGRVVYEWRPRPGAEDNHWLDNAVGCAAAASVEGVTLPGQATVGRGRGRRRIRLSKVVADRRHADV